MGNGSRWLVHRWRHPTIVSRLLLWPAAMLFTLLTALRRLGYRLGVLRTVRLPIPVIVVGNLTVGGSGKTPVVLHLIDALRAAGWHPGVVSRGYGSDAAQPRRVEAGDSPRDVGDEPALIHWATGAPVAVGADRASAARLLAEDCDVIVADDGLQHYRLGRDIEIAVVDGHEGLGNGWPLPAGPLRESVGRLDAVDFVAVRDGERPGAWRIEVRPDAARRVDGGAGTRTLDDWAGRSVHGVAGIGVPERFFSQLERAGIDVQRHAFADHHAYREADLAFGDRRDVLMTRKDAVKCRAFADARLWYLDASVEDRDGLAQAVIARLGALQTDKRS